MLIFLRKKLKRENDGSAAQAKAKNPVVEIGMDAKQPKRVLPVKSRIDAFYDV